MNPKDDEDFEKAAIENVKNFGEAQDVHHPDFGWILKDGKPTEAGMAFYQSKIVPTLTSDNASIDIDQVLRNMLEDISVMNWDATDNRLAYYHQIQQYLMGKNK